MASDLIFREDAKDYVRHAFAKGLNVLDYLDEVPAVNFRPVVRGTWEDCTEYNGEYRCSVCKEFEGHKRNYCPNCGTMMEDHK